MGGANKEALEEMYRVINWVLHTEDIGLFMAPKSPITEHGEIIWTFMESVIQHGLQTQMMDAAFLDMHYISWMY